MRQWEAAFVVLFEEAKGHEPTWDRGPGVWRDYIRVAKRVLERGLAHTKAKDFAQSVGRVMRDFAARYVEREPNDTGKYRIRDYASSAEKYEWLKRNYSSHFKKSESPFVVAAAIDSAPLLKVNAGAGFGDSIENKLVEDAAVDAVKTCYEKDGWTVGSVEREKRGFDLECRKGQVVENVEVKGVRGTKQSFIITAGEVEQARRNNEFVLIVVTSALSKSPVLTRYSGAEFGRKFELAAVQYRAVVRS
jgi:hypothetical protein